MCYSHGPTSKQNSGSAAPFNECNEKAIGIDKAEFTFARRTEVRTGLSSLRLSTALLRVMSVSHAVG